MAPARSGPDGLSAGGEDGGSFLGPLLRPLLLSLLDEGPAHGYALSERLDPLGMGPKRRATLYRALRQLEDGGLIASFWDASQTRGPVRRIYQVTAAGRRELYALMPGVATVAQALGEAVARQEARSTGAPRAGED